MSECSVPALELRNRPQGRQLMKRVRLGFAFVLSCIAVVVFLLASGCAHIEDSAHTGLLEGLESSDWTVRRDTADRLGNISPATSEIIQSLEGALEDYDSRVRRSAARSLGHIGPKAASACFISPVSSGTASEARVPICPRAQAADWITAVSMSSSRAISNGTADAAFGPIGPRERAADRRTRES